MGYELRLERDPPLDHAELERVAGSEAPFGLRGSVDAGEITVRHGEDDHPIARWEGALVGEPTSDWQVAHLAQLAEALGGRLVGEDGEVYGIRDGVVEQIHGESTYEFGKLDEILGAGPAEWNE